MTKEEIKAYNAAYHLKHRDKHLLAAQLWKANNRVAHRENSALWQKNNPVRSGLLKAAYKERNPEQTKDLSKRKSPQSLASHAARERVRNKSTSKPDGAVLAVYVLSATAESIECRWCEMHTSIGSRHVDHIVPLSAGGQHKAFNISIACKSCNLKKGKRLPAAFAARRTT